MKFEEKILFLSYHDQLTGLYNRRFVEEEIMRLDTPRQLPVSIIMGDINGLKLTNNGFGHRAGDLLLKKAAEVRGNKGKLPPGGYHRPLGRGRICRFAAPDRYESSGRNCQED